MKKETLVSIAERSGCSISTVSRVLSGNAAKYRISQRTVARVTEEVKRCNYTPSLLAKGLRTNRTDTIGLLIPNIENSFFAGVAGVVIRESRNYNYKVVVVDTQEDATSRTDCRRCWRGVWMESSLRRAATTLRCSQACRRAACRWC